MTEVEKKEDQPQQNKAEVKKEKPRVIGRWYIYETLGKGGYSWVKRGVDKTNNRVVALKFMDRRFTKTKDWNPKQEKQVKTEIEALKALKHPNIMKLYAYNLNAKYPDKTDDEKDEPKTPREVILLVLEYMPGGELFDILYYTSCLEDVIARTYFRQLVSALDACHKCGIIHRDLKPQNLLLDSSFTLKLTDFGLAKLVMKKEDQYMVTYHVGTRGYQAPEILLKDKNSPYTKGCDIFSCGVILFILLSGYPPFEHAKKGDRWYEWVINGEYRKFWRLHRGCGINPKAVDLITRCLLYDAKKRISIRHIEKHPWYKQDVLSTAQCYKVLKLKHKKMEVQRRRDPAKNKLLQNSVKRGLLDELQKRGLKLTDKPPDYGIDLETNKELDIGINDTYTTIGAYDVLDHIQQVIQHSKGKYKWNYENFELKAIVKIEKMKYKDSDPTKMHFETAMDVAAIFKMFYSNKYKCNILKIIRPNLDRIKTKKENDIKFLAEINAHKENDFKFFAEIRHDKIRINTVLANFRSFIDILYSHIGDSIKLPKIIAEELKTKKENDDVSTIWSKEDIELYNLCFPDAKTLKKRKKKNDKLTSKIFEKEEKQEKKDKESKGTKAKDVDDSKKDE